MGSGELLTKNSVMIKKIICIILLTLIFIKCIAPNIKELYIGVSEPFKPFEKVYYAQCDYESDHDPLAFNILEGATGIVQIRQCRVDDYNQRTGSNYTLYDMFDPVISKKVYMYFAMLHHWSDIEGVAKDWNGSGPMTIEYWEQIKKRL